MMDGVIALALAKKYVNEHSSSISDIQSEDGKLIFILTDGRQIKVDVPQGDISKAEVDADGDLKMTLADGTQVSIVTGTEATDEEIEDITSNLYN